MDKMLFFSRTARAEVTGEVILALQAADDATPVTVSGLELAWTPEGYAALRELWHDGKRQSSTRDWSLPYASLRALFEVYLPGVSRIDRGMRLSTGELRSASHQAPQLSFLWTDDEDEAVSACARRALEEWIANFLTEEFVRPAGVAQRHLTRVFEILRTGKMLVHSPYRAQVLPWQWSATGTAQRRTALDFAAMADYAARALAKTEIFPGLGGVRRIITQKGSAGIAELMTDPIDAGDKGTFSLLVRLEVVTFPSIRQPVLRVEIIKRRWLNALANDLYARGSVSGFMFPQGLPDRAPGFSIVRGPGADGVFQWEPDSAFWALHRHLHLPFGQTGADAIARGWTSTPDCTVRLVFRHGLREGRAIVKAGVPESDKLIAFEAVARALASLGFGVLGPLDQVRTTRVSPPASSNTINAPTLLGAMLYRSTGKLLTSLPPEYLRFLGNQEVDRLLRDLFNIELAAIRGGERIVSFEGSDGKSRKDQTNLLQLMVEENVRSVQQHYGPEKPQLVILYDEAVAGSSLKLLQSAVAILWGGALDVILQRLPKDTHGPRNVLPSADRRATERFEQRIDAWRSLARSIAGAARQTLCLVLAAEFYPGPAPETRSKDDKVNKPAGRKALATIARATVQYLLPVEMDRNGMLRLEDFLFKVQAALRDLVSGHAGRVDGVGREASRCFAQPEFAPREVIGITIVRKNGGRSRSGLEPTFLPVAVRIDVSSGRCELRYAHERAGRLHMSPWEPLARALCGVASVSPVTLAANQRERCTRFMYFCEAIIGESVDSGAQPVVIIDSSNCVQLWPWLADARINPDKIEIAEKQWMQDEWRGSRIVRVRQGLAPGVLINKAQEFEQFQTTSREVATASTRIERVCVPVSPGAPALYRLAEPKARSCVSYISVGGKMLHQHKRGLSCYRSVVLPAPAGMAPDGQKLYHLRAAGAFTEQWPTPDPIEMVVTLRQEDDDPDRVAEFVHSLRHGFGHYAEWSSLPAPLFFERVVRDYVCGFTLEDASEDDEVAEDDGSEEQ